MSAILNSKMADSRNLYFVLIFLRVDSCHDSVSLFVLRNAIFISEFIIWKKSVSSVDVNPDFVHQSNEVNEVIVLCFEKIKK